MVYQPREAFMVSTSIAARRINANRYDRIGMVWSFALLPTFLRALCVGVKGYCNLSQRILPNPEHPLSWRNFY